jgi:hypothetical protein
MLVDDATRAGELSPGSKTSGEFREGVVDGQPLARLQHVVGNPVRKGELVNPMGARVRVLFADDRKAFG